MAGSSRKVNVEVALSGEAKYKQAISELNAANKTMGAELKRLSAEYQGNSDSLEFLTQKGEGLQTMLDQQKEKVQQLREAVKWAAQEYGEASTKTQGYAAQSVLDGEQVYHIRAGRPGFKQADGDAAIPAGQPEDLGQRPRTFLILTSEMLGEENGGLGRGILESFLATLPGRRGLWRLALLNGAVKLATEPGPALGMLQKLADQGIGLLVHDASLAHFGLAHALQAGRSSGMGEIASSAEEADKVVRL